ncbi:putative Phosphatase 2C family protein [Tripterygium wilfordii]|uniref:Putative Phosphatase 2C family protein n=1 Tax=Tripterygium wilfordii TaxID=458696 RepID=A0A7J7CRM8_TRIWF|nr:putative protein phosphatase 2C-like protein 44 [Tripterygium wilfordii]KAF5736740.1 putative Phosphatase 2C family protein [Tripterygium wilfordii]
MGLKHLGLKLKGFRLRLFRIGDVGMRRREEEMEKKPSWMIPISHGYHVVDKMDESELDSVVVQREDIEGLEVWFYGVFDARIGDSVIKYMQSHFFDRFPKQCRIGRKSKQTMRKAYLSARAKAREAQKSDEKCMAGSASVMVINGEKLVIANMGNYRVVICRDGKAHQISTRHHRTAKKHWSSGLFLGGMLSWNYKNARGRSHDKGSEVAVGAEGIDSGTEFVILASNGIWEVMKNQEAVSLIHHIEDPQEAAAYLAKEAVNRMSKSCISCIVIRFD